MWVAKFTLKDDQDIYTPLCVKHDVIVQAFPYTNYVKDGKINLILGMVLSGKNYPLFIRDLKKDKRIRSVEQHEDFILIHAQHPVSREAKAELMIFYNPQYIHVNPVKLTLDGLELWEVGCVDRQELNKIVQAAIRHYHGRLVYLKKMTLKNVARMAINPDIPEKQLEAIRLAYSEGYYSYPRKLTIAKLAKISKKSYSTIQENLAKAENKLVEFFLKQ